MSDFLAMLSSTPLAAGNAPYVEAMYERFLADPDSVDPKWRDYFAAMGGLGMTLSWGLAARTVQSWADQA